MIKTRPISISVLTDQKFILGRRVSRLLAEPFEAEVLKKRVLRKTRDKKKGEAAYYIDTRDLDARIDAIVGPSNWSCDFNVTDLGDRVGVLAYLTIGGIVRAAESEEIKLQEGWGPQMQEVIVEDRSKEGMELRTVKFHEPRKDDKGDVIEGPGGKITAKELVLLRAGPNALKRAAVHFGIGAYLYGFADINTWEEIDSYGKFKNEKIEINDLPNWAKPTAGPKLVLQELSYLFDIQLPEDLKSLEGETLAQVQKVLNDNFGLTTLAKGLERSDYVELAGCMARISDWCDAHGATFQEFIDSLKKEN